MSRRLLIFLLGLLGLVVVAASCSHPVQPVLEVSPTTATLVPGQTLQLVVTRRFPGGPIDDVTHRVVYTSSNRNVVSVSNEGLVTAGDETGNALVWIGDTSSDAVVTATFSVVHGVDGGERVLRAIVVTPNPATITAGQTLQLSAHGVFSDGSMADMTSSVTWSSARDDIATVDANGVATGVAAGQTTITATAPAVTTIAADGGADDGGASAGAADAGEADDGGAADGGAASELVKGSTAVTVQ